MALLAMAAVELVIAMGVGLCCVFYSVYSFRRLQEEQDGKSIQASKRSMTRTSITRVPDTVKLDHTHSTTLMNSTTSDAVSYQVAGDRFWGPSTGRPSKDRKLTMTAPLEKDTKGTPLPSETTPLFGDCIEDMSDKEGGGREYEYEHLLEVGSQLISVGASAAWYTGTAIWNSGAGVVSYVVGGEEDDTV